MLALARTQAVVQVSQRKQIHRRRAACKSTCQNIFNHYFEAEWALIRVNDIIEVTITLLVICFKFDFLQENHKIAQIQKL